MKMLKTIIAGLSLAVAVAPQAQAMNLDSFKNFGQSIVDQAYVNPALATITAVSILAATGLVLKGGYDKYQQYQFAQTEEGKLIQDAAAKGEIVALLNDWVNNDNEKNYSKIFEFVKNLNLLKNKQPAFSAINDIKRDLKFYNQELNVNNQELNANNHGVLYANVNAFCGLVGLDKTQVFVKDRHTKAQLQERVVAQVNTMAENSSRVISTNIAKVD